LSEVNLISACGALAVPPGQILETTHGDDLVWSGGALPEQVNLFWELPHLMYSHPLCLHQRQSRHPIACGCNSPEEWAYPRRHLRTLQQSSPTHRSHHDRYLTHEFVADEPYGRRKRVFVRQADAHTDPRSVH